MSSLFMRPARYGTNEVALILGTEQWRIKNFALHAYGLEPSIKATGRGTRRYYSFEAVLLVAVADELYSAHFSPAGIKGAVDRIKSDEVIQRWVKSYSDAGTAHAQFLVLADPETKKTKETKTPERVWRVSDGTRATGSVEAFLESGAVAVSLNLVELWESVVKRITELEGEGRI
jgi:hypothetical protein